MRGWNGDGVRKVTPSESVTSVGRLLICPNASLTIQLVEKCLSVRTDRQRY